MAKALGVDESTVRADLGKRAAGNPAAPPTEAAENNGADTADAANPAPAWFQDNADPSKLAKSRERIQKARTNKILVITMPLVFCRELDLHDGSTYDIDARP